MLFLNGLGGADGETMKQMLANYVKENPSVSIDFQTLGWDDVFKKLDTTLAPPQVMAGQFPQIGSKPVVWMNSHELTIPIGISGTKFDQAQKLILWISDHNVDWAQSGQPPARLSAQNSPILQQDWAWSVRKFAEVTTKYGRYEVAPPQYTLVRNLQYKAFDEVIANKEPVKTILDDYANQIKGVQANH